MVYVGYPITLNTAYSIFNYPCYYTPVQLKDMLDTHLEKHGLSLYFYDKGVYILGLRVKELCGKNDKYVFADKAIELLILYKQQVIDNLKGAGANLSIVDIQILEGDVQRVYNPQPYIVSE